MRVSVFGVGRLQLPQAMMILFGLLFIVSCQSFKNETSLRSRTSTNYDYGSNGTIQQHAATTTTTTTTRVLQSDWKLTGKKGIGMGMSWMSSTVKDRIQYLKPYWLYNWGPTLPTTVLIPGVEFIPMMKTCPADDPNYADKFVARILPDIQSGKTKRVLGYNEPDRERQANIPVSQAVKCWPTLQNMDVLLGAPVVGTNNGDWLPEWRKEAAKRGFRIDYTPVHWYDEPSFKKFTNKMRQIYEENGKKPLLITEFAPADWSATSPATNQYTQAQVLSFMKQIMPWLENRSWIAGYAWFPFRTDSAPGACSAFFDTNGNPTVLATYYQSVRRITPKGNQSISV